MVRGLGPARVRNFGLSTRMFARSAGVEFDWSWLVDPEWLVPFLLTGAVLACFLTPPFRRVWREPVLLMAALVLAMLGLLIAPLREQLYGMGVVLASSAVWLFLGAPGKLGWLAESMGDGDPDQRPVIDEDVEAYDVDDPASADPDAKVAPDTVPWSEIVRGLDEPR